MPYSKPATPWELRDVHLNMYGVQTKEISLQECIYLILNMNLHWDISILKLGYIF
jgi:hypothetical protein